MSNPTELPDLDLNELEAIALAATPGPWKGDRYDGTIKYDLLGKDDETVIHGDNGNSDHGPFGIENEEDANYLLAFHPATALRLIELARRAQPEGEAPQAENMTIHRGWAVYYDNLGLEPYQSKWVTPFRLYDSAEEAEAGFSSKPAHYKAHEVSIYATLSPLCGAQHAESGKEAAILANDSAVPDWNSYAAAEVAQQAAGPTHCDPAEGFCAKCRADERAAQLDGGQEGSESNG